MNDKRWDLTRCTGDDEALIKNIFKDISRIDPFPAARLYEHEKREILLQLCDHNFTYTYINLVCEVYARLFANLMRMRT